MSLTDPLNEALENALESPEEAIKILAQIGLIKLCLYSATEIILILEKICFIYFSLQK